MTIGHIDVGRDLLIVAEIGNNHEGRIEIAERLVREARVCGADAVKFQTFRTECFVRPADAERYRRLSAFELGPEAFARLHAVAREEGLLFLSTPLDLPSVTLLRPLVDAYKIASGDNTFFPLLDAVCETGLPIIVSSGVSDLPLLERVKAYIEERWRERGIEQSLAVLHCVSCYPAAADQLNLAAIPVLARELECVVGYSDHSVGIQACLTAVALGARIVEKHFTLDKEFSDFRDHQLSADPAEFRRMVVAIREVQAMLGAPEKRLRPCEAAMEPQIRRSIVAAGALAAGHCLTPADLLWMRPADGLPPGREREVLGRVLTRAVAKGDAIVPDCLE